MAKKKVRTPVDFSELGGYRYLHFGSEWIQGGMQINRSEERRVGKEC